MNGATLPWQRIVLATEHTEFDAGAERVAIALARGGGQPLGVVVPALVNAQLIAVAPELAERADEAAAARGKEMLRIAAEAGVRVDVRVRESDEAQDAIVSHARDTHADLVVIRRVGRRGFLSRLLVGEMAGAVASRAPCDVLLVPRDAESWRRAVLAAVDASASAARVAGTTASIARSSGLPVFVASVAADAGESSRAQADASVRSAVEALARDGIAATGDVRVGKPAAEIIAAAAERGADLIVVGRRGASGGLHRALLGSTALKVVGAADCPVLVVGD